MSALTETLRELRPTLRLALPITTGHVGQILLGLTDSVMVGRVGAVPLAASAFAGALFGLAFLIGIGLLTPVAVRAAEAFGASRLRAAGETLRHGCVLAAVSAVLLALAITGLSGTLHWFGQPPEVVATARPYLIIVAWSLLPSLGFVALKSFYEALHEPWTPLYCVLGGVLLNGFLNWVLIYGHLGSPPFGLAGAGWATLIARLAMLAALGWHLRHSRSLAPMQPPRWWAPLQYTELATQFAKGWPVSLQLFFEVSLFSVSAVFMGWLGTVALAAHQVAINCASATFMFPLGLSHALAVRIGHARGANQSHLLRVIGFGGIGLGAALMAGFGVVLVCAGPQIARGFIHDPEVVTVAARLLIVVGLFQIFDGTQVTAMGALRGLGDVRLPTVITFVGYWLCAIPIAWVGGFALQAGPVGVWTGLATGLGFCALFLARRFALLTRAERVAC
jgi:MATE family multidrug resistance protein